MVKRGLAVLKNGLENLHQSILHRACQLAVVHSLVVTGLDAMPVMAVDDARAGVGVHAAVVACDVRRPVHTDMLVLDVLGVWPKKTLTPLFLTLRPHEVHQMLHPSAEVALFC